MKEEVSLEEEHLTTSKTKIKIQHTKSQQLDLIVFFFRQKMKRCYTNSIS